MTAIDRISRPGPDWLGAVAAFVEVGVWGSQDAVGHDAANCEGVFSVAAAAAQVAGGSHSRRRGKSKGTGE